LADLNLMTLLHASYCIQEWQGALPRYFGGHLWRAGPILWPTLAQLQECHVEACWAARVSGCWLPTAVVQRNMFLCLLQDTRRCSVQNVIDCW